MVPVGVGDDVFDPLGKGEGCGRSGRSCCNGGSQGEKGDEWKREVNHDGYDVRFGRLIVKYFADASIVVGCSLVLILDQCSTKSRRPGWVSYSWDTAGISPHRRNIKVSHVPRPLRIHGNTLASLKSPPQVSC